MNGIESLLKQQDLSVPLSTAQGVSNVPFQRWFKFKEAFSPKFVHDTIQKSLIKVDKILDPFGGSGTTALTSQLMGINPTTIEVNPFLADLIESKLTEYNTQKLISDWVFVSKNVGLENPSLETMFSNAPKTLFEDKDVERWIFNREIIFRIAQYREIIKKLDD
ncbi:TPA: DNA methylase N-4/N-6, partial [Salmonella enterica subsp. enterica serovar Choleraesuis]|nr:DNA methylase N-4/N-6 [Salmonella enterica subsp. enterica serovar Choleraesuis]